MIHLMDWAFDFQIVRPAVTDLKKARWYLNRLIEELEKLVE